jgi:nicotinamide mononucleotide transporter
MSFGGVTVTEVLGFLTGVVNVWLLARQSIWNWPIGIANNSLYLVVFLHSGLYGDAALQIFFALLNAYGWWHWLRPGAGRKDLPVTLTGRGTWMWLAPTTMIGAALLALFLSRFTDSTVPGWDGVTTALSLAATYGQTRKLLESWWLWIAADLIYIPLYVYKDLWLTAVLYAIFLALCMLGLRSWWKALETRPVTAG